METRNRRYKGDDDGAKLQFLFEDNVLATLTRSRIKIPVLGVRTQALWKDGQWYWGKVVSPSTAKHNFNQHGDINISIPHDFGIHSVDTISHKAENLLVPEMKGTPVCSTPVNPNKKITILDQIILPSTAKHVFNQHGEINISIPHDFGIHSVDTISHKAENLLVPENIDDLREIKGTLVCSTPVNPNKKITILDQIILPNTAKPNFNQNGEMNISTPPDFGSDTGDAIPQHQVDNYRTDRRRKVPEHFKCGNSSLLEQSTLNLKVGVDISKLKVNPSGKKKHFCCYCETLQSKFARHLELKHNTEKDVQKFTNLPKGNHERLSIIDAIRKRGNFIHNTNTQFNTGVLITSRQRQHAFLNMAQDYVCCANCKGFFFKRTLRLHYKKCNESHKKGTRVIHVMGRRLTGFLHNRANDILRHTVFPVLTDDNITKSIQYDELLIVFGNKLCEKYKTHQHDMIRAHLRLLGRFKLAIKKINKEISDFASIFQPQHFDSAINALRECAKWDRTIMWFKTPAVANNLTTLLKKLAHCLRAECIKKQDEDKKRMAENFLVLFEEEIPVLINKPAIEDQIKQRRLKKVILPSKDDIRLLHDYLKNKCLTCTETLGKGFDLNAWKILCEATLVSVMIFNRRRAGEIERITLSDFQCQERIDVNTDLFNQMSTEHRNHAQKFVRVTLRGKLGRTVPILLKTFLIKSIELILKFRHQAGVHPNNEYIFSVPNTTNNGVKKPYLRACELLRLFSQECGASIPSTLRGTTLRKHIATHIAMLGIEEDEVSDLANFMGHSKNIHKEYYRIPVTIRDVTNVSKLLEAAMGKAETDEDESGDDIDFPKQSHIVQNHSLTTSLDSTSHLDSTRSPGSDQIYAETQTRCDKISSSYVSLPGSSNTKHGCPPKGADTSMDSPGSFNASGEKRRSTSPYGKTKRVKWSEEERKAASEYFGDFKALKKLPSLDECHKAIMGNTVLQKRQPQQLKTWIDNQRRAETRRQSYAVKHRYL